MIGRYLLHKLKGVLANYYPFIISVLLGIASVLYFYVSLEIGVAIGLFSFIVMKATQKKLKKWAYYIAIFFASEIVGIIYLLVASAFYKPIGKNDWYLYISLVVSPIIGFIVVKRDEAKARKIARKFEIEQEIREAEEKEKREALERWRANKKR